MGKWGTMGKRAKRSDKVQAEFAAADNIKNVVERTEHGKMLKEKFGRALDIKGPVLVIGYISDGPDTEESSWSVTHIGDIRSAQQLAEWLAKCAGADEMKPPLPTTILIVKNDEVVKMLTQAAGDFQES